MEWVGGDSWPISRPFCMKRNRENIIGGQTNRFLHLLLLLLHTHHHQCHHSVYLLLLFRNDIVFVSPIPSDYAVVWRQFKESRKWKVILVISDQWPDKIGREVTEGAKKERLVKNFTCFYSYPLFHYFSWISFLFFSFHLVRWIHCYLLSRHSTEFIYLFPWQDINMRITENVSQSWCVCFRPCCLQFLLAVRKLHFPWNDSPYQPQEFLPLFPC